MAKKLYFSISREDFYSSTVKLGRYLYDLYYIFNYSLLLDIKIIFKTFFVILHLK